MLLFTQVLCHSATTVTIFFKLLILAEIGTDTM